MRLFSVLVLAVPVAISSQQSLSAQSVKPSVNNKQASIPRKKMKERSPHALYIKAIAGVKSGMARDLPDLIAAGGITVTLDNQGDGLSFSHLPTAKKLAIHYASLNSGTFSIYLNGVFTKKVNLHSTGGVSGSYLNAIVDLPIPANATLSLQYDEGDTSWSVDRIAVGSGDLGLKPDIWNLPALVVQKGRFKPDWQQMSRKYRVPDWFREGKFGAWSHWDPQSMPEQGDWYARNMYEEGQRVYNYHVKTFGHPSEFGYKDICHLWKVDKWDPDALVKLYVEMGAKYFVAMGNHHDNFDNWNSKYQPWNSVNVGPRQDIVGTWEKAARKQGLRFGIGFHASPPRTWGQFMPERYKSDKSGPKKGIPYDGLMTIADGKGKWWEGYDPVDLYGPPHKSTDPSLTSPFADQFMWRVDDAVSKYHPDLIYFDEGAGSNFKDLGVSMGLGVLAPQLVANYYNKSMLWNHGKMDVVINLKNVGGRYNSFKDHPEQIPLVEESLVKSSEKVIETNIMAYPFQTETSISEWHYQTGQKYLTSGDIVKLLIENVCRNGAMLLNLTQHGDGHLDNEVIRTCKEVGAWLSVNGNAIYGSRPYEVYGEGDARYTRAKGFIYVTLLHWPENNTLTLPALRAGGATIGKVKRVSLLGSSLPISFQQDAGGLKIAIEGKPDTSQAYVFKISQDKTWINDDDPGITYTGWIHRCNLNTADFNNDLHLTNVKGDGCTLHFTGNGVSIIAPKDPSYGIMEVFIDGKSYGKVNLKGSGRYEAECNVFTLIHLSQKQHTLKLVNLSNVTIALDAFKVFMVRDL
jgi:alpha-L-fucosidase